MSEALYVRVALDHPLATLFDYRYRGALPPRVGMLALVPFGKRLVVGLICEVATHTEVPENRLRERHGLRGQPRRADRQRGQRGARRRLAARRSARARRACLLYTS
ncbi:hypothetical protein PPH41_41270, partial [Burkholderia gladioli]|nr:hypothetical protein [Burkholderia gladioli]